jgi:hypothetical protein
MAALVGVEDLQLLVDAVRAGIGPQRLPDRHQRFMAVLDGFEPVVLFGSPGGISPTVVDKKVVTFRA